jgi:hypothetical protein
MVLNILKVSDGLVTDLQENDTKNYYCIKGDLLLLAKYQVK